MALAKLLNLFAVSTLAVLVCNLGVSPVNALSADGHRMHKVRHAHGHDVAMKRKRGDGQRCKQRSAAPAPTSSSSSNSGNSGSNNNGNGNGSSSSSSNPPKQTSSPPAQGGNGKIGLAWPPGNPNTLKSFVTENVKYIYTWTEQCPDGASELGLQCLPMLWGNKDTDAFQKTVVQGYANIALGFNEVNEPQQANLDPDTAVGLWWKYLEPLKDKGYQLLAPVTSSNPNGYTWMQEFLQKCNGCHIDGFPVHYYGTSADDMQSYIEKWSGFGKPIWVTEFACQNYNTAYENNGQQCSNDQVWAFYSQIVKYMEGNDNVVAYFPFGSMLDLQGVNTLDSLMQQDGQPTALGSTIINVSFQ